MHRITGDAYWRVAGWRMISSILKATKTELGHSAIGDVTVAEPEFLDNMESFWLAETLKYAYLLFDDEKNWSLDDWVMNTEAHLFKRPKS
jgi:mannosyl-oligosaccharide alpha-1,2-mannosidase